MKSRILLGFWIVIFVSVLSCKTKEPVASNTPSSSAPAPASTEESEKEAAKTISADRERVANKESWTGTEIVTEAVGRLDSKLALSKETEDKMRAILEASFKSTGGKMDGTYPTTEARSYGKKIIVNSKDLIIEYLETDDQRSTFKDLFLK